MGEDLPELDRALAGKVVPNSVVPPAPTADQCSANEPFEVNGRRGFAIWYPQMGGYVGKAVVFADGDGPEPCVDLLVWHDGQFPFEDEGEQGRRPARLHHCDPEQFARFGEQIRRLIP